MADKTSKKFPGPRHSPLAQRLDYYTDRSGGPDACWPWTSALNSNGYGVIHVAGVARRAHRLAWIEANGPIPPDKPHLLHRCDNPRCVNPAHLRTGTHKENMADMIARGRARHDGLTGSRNGSAKLTEADVRAIRAAGGSQRAIATRFGVHQGTVSNILLGKNWKHVT
jgi:hypothetical protein